MVKGNYMKPINKKGQVMEQLGALGVGVAVLGITLVIAFLIMSTAKSNISDTEYCADSSHFTYNGSICCNNSAVNCLGTPNSSGDMSYAVDGIDTLTNATAEIPSWIPLVIIAFVGALLLGLVAMFRR